MLMTRKKGFVSFNYSSRFLLFICSFFFHMSNHKKQTNNAQITKL